MKLVIVHYLQSLRERDELDAILPDLLSETGYEILTRPRRGTRQAGVDVAAVGPDAERGGRRSLFLLTVKSGDLTRAHWDGSQQAVRSSLNEILDDYIPNRIPSQYRDLPIVVCVCMGGEMREDVRAAWSGFCSRSEQPNLRFVEWNGEHVADILLTGVLRAELVDGEHRGIFQKALAMLDQPDVAYRHFSHLVHVLLNAPLDERDITRRLRQAYLCLWILFVWSRDVGNLEAAYRGAELVLLRTWPHCDATRIDGAALRIERTVHMDQVLRLHLIVSRLLLVEKIGPFADKRFALSMAVQSRSANDVNMALFETLGRMSLHGIWLHQISEMHSDEFGAECDAQAGRALDLAIETINANPTLAVPIRDEFAIEIALFMHLAHLRGRLRNVGLYVRAMGEHLRFALATRDGYPTASTDYRTIVNHPSERSKEYFEEHTRASVLYPLILTWLTALGETERRDQLLETLREVIPHTTHQVWIPDATIDEVFWHGDRDHGLAVPDVALDQSVEQMVRVLNDLIKRYPVEESIGAVRLGLYPMLLTACRHYRLPIPIHFWLAPSAETRPDSPDQVDLPPESGELF